MKKLRNTREINRINGVRLDEQKKNLIYGTFIQRKFTIDNLPNKHSRYVRFSNIVIRLSV